SEQPKQPETVETTEPPIPETSEETVETTTPSAEDYKESSEENGLPSPVLPKKEETEQLMVLPEAMRMSTYSLPNLNAYRPYLVNNGKSAYIEDKMQKATNRNLTLGAEAGAVQRFTVTFDAYAMVQGVGNDWISWIASNLSTAPDYYFKQMYYGNHPSFSNPYTLNNLRWSGVPSYLSATATPTISGRQVTINVLVTRLEATTSNTNEKDTIRLLGNLTMGTTAVAPEVNNYSKKIADVNYSDAVIGEIIVNNPKPSVGIKDSVDIEATRNALSQDTIKSWFSTLPSNPNDYTFSATGPASWAPGAKGTATVVMKHNSNGTTQTFTTRYTVRDTQAPTGTVKSGTIDVEARRKDNLSQDELRQFFTTVSDNWTLPNNIKIHLVDGNGTATTVAGKAPGTHLFNLQLEDEAGNKSSRMEVRIRIVDTQAPTATVKTQGVEIEARRIGDWTRTDLLKFIDGDLQDNWSLPENIRIEATDNYGIYPIAGSGPGNKWAYLDIYDEAGNKYQKYVVFKVVDTQAPTGTVKNGTIDVEARRKGNLTKEELRQFFKTVSDNWTLPKNIKFHLVNADGSAASIAGVKPGTALDAHIQLEDEAGNKSAPMKISARIVDTVGPQGTVKENLSFYEGSAEPNVRDYLEGEPSDNWTLPEAIKATIVYENNAEFTDLKVGTHKFILTLTDESGNTTDFSGQLKIKKDLRGYIDVTIPVRISFAESKESGGIVSPKYKIQNNSNEELTVSVASMTSQSQTEKLTDIDLLMSNNYNDSTIPLIENGQNLSQKTELVTLPKKTSSFAFSLSGTVGQNFDFDSLTDPLKPQYALQFNFEIN
ncbi:MAG TPA: hypothetical protein K8V64_10550, partial [Enterococcus durans]|nr:hypothetical protein [Enterococcus durans]